MCQPRPARNRAPRFKLLGHIAVDLAAPVSCVPALRERTPFGEVAFLGVLGVSQPTAVHTARAAGGVPGTKLLAGVAGDLGLVCVPYLRT